MEIQNATKKIINREPDSLRLSRMKNELSSLLCELHSYRCEPCTPDMHEQYMKLDDYGRELKQAIDKITDSVVYSKIIDDEINGVMKSYNKFQKNLTSYQTEAIVHH